MLHVFSLPSYPSNSDYILSAVSSISSSSVSLFPMEHFFRSSSCASFADLVLVLVFQRFLQIVFDIPKFVDSAVYVFAPVFTTSEVSHLFISLIFRFKLLILPNQ